jgi:hypothetical protein
MELSETFYLTLMATGAGILGLIIKKISASKCDEINCWGIHIHRRVELEKDDVIESQDSKTNL